MSESNWQRQEALEAVTKANMQRDEEEQFMAEWVFDESQCKTTVTEDDQLTSRDEVALTPPEVVRRVYALGRTLAEVFEEFSLHFWDSIQYTLESK